MSTSVAIKVGMCAVCVVCVLIASENRRPRGRRTNNMLYPVMNSKKAKCALCAKILSISLSDAVSRCFSEPFFPNCFFNNLVANPGL